MVDGVVSVNDLYVNAVLCVSRQRCKGTKDTGKYFLPNKYKTRRLCICAWACV